MDRVFCIGELLIDFICKDIGKGLKNGINFEKKAGGAPANVAAAVSKLGGNSYFLGQVGNDSFGKYLVDVLEKVNIDTSMMTIDGNTTLSFVAIDGEGERDFEFHRGSDGDYELDDMKLSHIEKGDIIHFGSATGFLPGKLRDSYFKLLEYGNKEGIFTSFDPNYRENLISNDYLDEFIKYCKYFIERVDFIKLSLEEARLITGEEDIYNALECIHSYGGNIVCITLGPKGTLLSNGEDTEIVPSIEVEQVDSTGAGDAFVGGVLKKLSYEENKEGIGFDRLKEIIKYGNIVGAMTCTKYGAIDSIPSKSMVENIF